MIKPFVHISIGTFIKGHRLKKYLYSLIRRFQPKRKELQISLFIGNRLHPPALIAVSRPFLAIFLTTMYLSIFHKTEVQTVILRCWRGLNLNWFKSYDTKCKYFSSDLANSWNVNGCFSTISSQFFAIYINIFHKTEVQTVILRCWMGLNLNWFKNYDTKRKWGGYY